MEMAFADEEHVIHITETVIKSVFDSIAGVRLGEDPFSRMTYQKAMSSYGSDKPDLRLGAEVGDLLYSPKQ